jgi:tight adherence protein B
MMLIVVLIFVGVFAVVAPVLVIGSGAGSTRSNKQVIATLDTALGTSTQEKPPPVINFRKSDQASAIPWLNSRLARMNVVPILQRLLNQADLKWTVGALVLFCLACFAIPSYLIDLRTGSFVFALVVGVVLGLMPIGYVLFMRGKRFKKFESGLPDALDLMVSALRVGHSFSSAMGLVTRECADPVGSEFKIAFDEQNFGLDLRVALDNLTYRIPLQDLKIVVTAILIQRESGGNLAEVLEKTAYVIRQRFRLKRQVGVHTAQGRLTGWILTILPVALGIGLYIVNPDTMSLLWKREIGIKLLYGAGASLVIGTLLIQKIVRMEV